jgi:hypothetical protein
MARHLPQTSIWMRFGHAPAKPDVRQPEKYLHRYVFWYLIFDSSRLWRARQALPIGDRHIFGLIPSNSVPTGLLVGGVGANSPAADLRGYTGTAATNPPGARDSERGARAILNCRLTRQTARRPYVTRAIWSMAGASAAWS